MLVELLLGALCGTAVSEVYQFVKRRVEAAGGRKIDRDLLEEIWAAVGVERGRAVTDEAARSFAAVEVAARSLASEAPALTQALSQQPALTQGFVGDAVVRDLVGRVHEVLPSAGLRTAGRSPRIASPGWPTRSSTPSITPTRKASSTST